MNFFANNEMKPIHQNSQKQNENSRYERGSSRYSRIFFNCDIDPFLYTMWK